MNEDADQKKMPRVTLNSLVAGRLAGVSLKEVYGRVTILGTAEVKPAEEPFMTFLRATTDAESRLSQAVKTAFPEANAIIPFDAFEVEDRSEDPTRPWMHHVKTNRQALMGDAERMTVCVKVAAVKLSGPGFGG